MKTWLGIFLICGLILIGCPNDNNNNGDNNGDGITPPEVLASPVELEGQPPQAELAALFSAESGFPAALSDTWKIWGHHNALITQGFGADPTAMEYDGRLYVFSSNDSLMYDSSGALIQMTYAGGIQGLRALSSADMVNWTDHGLINIHGPVSTNPLVTAEDTPQIGGDYATASWAPSAAWKMINGKPKFFVYYANSGNGIGVISADSPTGPWTTPLESTGKLLIDRDTPNCATVDYLFDPGVMVDRDGQGYLFFGGGGGSSGEFGYTGQARRVKLGADMISLDGDPEIWEVPYLFEDNEIINIDGTYYYSYVTNSAAGSAGLGLQGTQIAYLTADDPMGEFSYPPKGILRSPMAQLNVAGENNHHCIFQFKRQYYIAYHACTVIRAMGSGLRYRSTHIDKITIDPDGSILPVTMTRKGVDQVGKFNPYVLNEAETIGTMGGVNTRAEAGAGNGMLVTSIDTGDWIGLYGVDFGSGGAKKFTARVRMPETPDDFVGAIELRLDPAVDGTSGDNAILNGVANRSRIKDGTVIGRVQFKSAEAGYAAVTVDLDQTVTGIHDLAFVFYSSLGVRPETVATDSRHKDGFEFDQWYFLP